MNIIKELEKIKQDLNIEKIDDLINKLDGQILISSIELEELSETSAFMTYLQGCGVDNWEGYDEAVQMFTESMNE